MVIVRFQGGLGNQMFQYAFYKSLQYFGKKVKADISMYQNYLKHNGFELTSIFGVDIDLVQNEEIIFYTTMKYKLNGKTYYFLKIFSENTTNFIPEVFEVDNIYFNGYWQSEKYFKQIATEIKKTFKIELKEDKKNSDLLDIIQNTNSVSVHIRLGDYVNEERTRNIHYVCDLNYYKKAINYIETKVKNPIYFVFSNEIDKVKEKLNLPNAFFIDWNVGKDSYKDLILMSNCKHNIIANSSFSWWGAYLNGNADKIVITPKKWLRTEKEEHKGDIFQPEWIRI